MIGRVVMTFLPVVLLKKHSSIRKIRHAQLHGIPLSDEKREKYMRRLKSSTRLLQVMLFIPFIVFWVTIVAALERTPLTGRWRTILLSPEEEDEIADQLTGDGWYRAVNEILSEEGPPKLIHPGDWRYQWVRDTFQRLVSVLPILADEEGIVPRWADLGPDDSPLPPPSEHPLHPRPRGADYIRILCQRVGWTAPKPREESQFSLLLVNSPEHSNAFSYGFWPDGGHGVVVYSGFLDDIFAKYPLEYVAMPDERSWLSRVLGIGAPPQPQPVVTEEQTADLAILLAHELSHLILAHHLESLSSSSIVVPGTLSILADVLRVVVFPITMFLGPFVNDAMGHLGNVGSAELKNLGEWCTTMTQEEEADVVSTRILAYAGFDARDAIKFWETRATQETEPECHPVVKDQVAHHAKFHDKGLSGLVRTGHPDRMKRIAILRQELQRWEDARKAARPE